MRISVRKNDKGYHPQAPSCRVLLNGIEISECFTADEELGEAYCWKKTEDEYGQSIEVKTGIVEIIKPDNFVEI